MMSISKSVPKLDIFYKGKDVRKLGFKWAGKTVGQRSKIGGNPEFIQSENIPNCKCCQTPMTFYAQLDPLSDEVCFADCGMIYVFVCFNCFNVESFIQSE